MSSHLLFAFCEMLGTQDMLVHVQTEGRLRSLIKVYLSGWQVYQHPLRLVRLQMVLRQIMQAHTHIWSRQ